MNRLTRGLWLCLLGLSCAPPHDEPSPLPAQVLDTQGTRLSEPVNLTADNDTTPPQVHSLTPSSVTTVYGDVGLEANVTDDRGIVARVEFLIDSVVVGEAAEAPFRVTWDSTAVANGYHNYSVRAHDPSGNVSAWAGPSLRTVSGADTPWVRIQSPWEGAALGGTRYLSAYTTGGLKIIRNEFYLDDSLLLGASSSNGASVIWDTRTAPVGPHTLTAWAYDNTGKVLKSAPMNVTVDPSPTVSITSPAEGTVMAGTVSLKAAVTDNAPGDRVVFYAVNPNGNQQLCTGYAPGYSCLFSSRTQPNGPLTLRAETTDAAANTAVSAVLNVTLDNDLVAPTVSITSPAEGDSVGGLVTVSADASDDRGLLRVEFFRGNSLIATLQQPPFSFQWNTTALADGTYTLKARAWDQANNLRDSAPRTLTVTREKTPPTVTFLSPSGSGPQRDVIGVAVDAIDDLSGIQRVEFFLGNTLFATDTSSPYSVTLNTRAHANGAQQLVARAYDGVGNAGSATLDVTLDNDFTPPTVSLTSPTAGSTLTETVTIAANVSDEHSRVSRVDFFAGETLLSSDSFAPYASAVNTRTLANGPAVLTAKAYDIYGNQGTASVTVTVDNDITPPTVSIASPIADSTVSGSLSFTANASDSHGISRVEFYLEGNRLVTDTVAPYTVDVWTRSYTNGRKTLSVNAYDTAGNLSTASVTVTFDNDFTPPTVAIPSPTANSSLSRLFLFSANASDSSGISRVEFSLEGTPLYLDDSEPYGVYVDTRQYPNGSKTLTAKAYDRQGNMATSSVLVTFDNDRTPPTVSLTAPVSGATVSGSITLRASASDNVEVARVAFYVDGVLYGTVTGAPYQLSWNSTTHTPGAVNFTARAYDAADNEGVSATVYATVSNAAPGGPTSLSYNASSTSSAMLNTVNKDISLAAGQTLTLGTCGVSGASFSGDTYLRLLGPGGTQVAANDDACGGVGSNFTYTVPSGGAGNYQLRAGCYSSGSCSGVVVWTIR